MINQIRSYLNNKRRWLTDILLKIQPKWQKPRNLKFSKWAVWGLGYLKFFLKRGVQSWHGEARSWALCYLKLHKNTSSVKMSTHVSGFFRIQFLKVSFINFQNTVDGANLCIKCMDWLGIPWPINISWFVKGMLRSLCYLQLHEILTELFKWRSGPGSGFGKKTSSVSHFSTMLSDTLGNGKVSKYFSVMLLCFKRHAKQLMLLLLVGNFQVCEKPYMRLKNN